MHLVAFYYFIVDNRRRIVFGVFSRASRISKNRRSKNIVWVRIGSTHAFVNHIGDAHLRIPLHVHTDFNEHRHDTCVLTDWPFTLSTHTRVNKNLRHCIFCRLRLFAQISFVHCSNKVSWVVVRNELQRVRNAFDQIVLAYRGHISLFYNV